MTSEQLLYRALVAAEARAVAAEAQIEAHRRECPLQMTDAEVDEDLRALGLDPAEVAARGRTVMEESLSMFRRLAAETARADAAEGEVARLQQLYDDEVTATRKALADDVRRQRELEAEVAREREMRCMGPDGLVAEIRRLRRLAEYAAHRRWCYQQADLRREIEQASRCTCGLDDVLGVQHGG